MKANEFLEEVRQCGSPEFANGISFALSVYQLDRTWFDELASTFRPARDAAVGVALLKVLGESLVGDHQVDNESLYLELLSIGVDESLAQKLKETSHASS